MRLAAGAATAGVAYNMGKKSQRQAEYNEQAAAAYEATQSAAQQATAAPTPPTPSPTSTDPTIDELTRLASLHQAGVLTDNEFTAAKAKLLGI